MHSLLGNRWVLVALFTRFLLPVGQVEAATPNAFYKAYYLEKEQREWNKAAALYEEVAADRRAEPAIRKQATSRLAALKEDLATRDLATLMPAGALAYIEIRNPGEKLVEFVDQLGLLADPSKPVATEGKRVAISPALIRELLGIRGAAVAVTGFDPFKQEPAGVLVFHPGDIDVIRALIETALPVGGDGVKAIGGFATFKVEDKVFVTLTSRLVVVSPQRALIENVVGRLQGGSQPSLASDPAFAKARKEHDGSLVFFSINAKPIMPMVNSMMAGMGTNNPEVAMAQALLDPSSLESLVGSIGLNGESLTAQLSLNLAEGHKNLVFDFLRTPAVNWDTLRAVPAGSAFFLAGAINEASSRFQSKNTDGGETRPYVSMLDIGREVFSNITSLAVFAVPRGQEAGGGGGPIPDVGIVITVNDPSKSEALWGKLFGIASLAAGATDMSGSPMQVAGVNVRRFSLPDGVTIHFATDGSNVLISTTEYAMLRSLQAKRGGKSVLEDPAYAANLKQLDDSTTKGLFVHAGRALEMAKLWMSKEEAAEMQRFAKPLANTVAGLVISHSDHALRLSGSITGIPDVGDMVASLITEQSNWHKQEESLRKAMRNQRWNDATAIVRDMQAIKPGASSLLVKEFDIFAVGKKDHEAAALLGEEIYQATSDDAQALNNFAWALLTDDDYGQHYGELALKMSERSNQLTKQKNWAYLDTLAHAKFAVGDASAAVALEQRAMTLAEGRSADALAEALARFEAGAGKDAVAVGDPAK